MGGVGQLLLTGLRAAGDGAYRPLPQLCDLRPLRQLIPPVGGMLDLTPIIAYVLLTLLSSLLMKAIPV